MKLVLNEIPLLDCCKEWGLEPEQVLKMAHRGKIILVFDWLNLITTFKKTEADKQFYLLTGYYKPDSQKRADKYQHDITERTISAVAYCRDIEMRLATLNMPAIHELTCTESIWADFGHSIDGNWMFQLKEHREFDYCRLPRLTFNSRSDKFWVSPLTFDKLLVLRKEKEMFEKAVKSGDIEKYEYSRGPNPTVNNLALDLDNQINDWAVNDCSKALLLFICKVVEESKNKSRFLKPNGTFNIDTLANYILDVFKDKPTYGFAKSTLKSQIKECIDKHYRDIEGDL
ncbi:hypothetical protein [Glaciecola sp. 1036]|uniref:hypothetical protein n=1 Tax=Alteromonadaceae TaxID=72275 RepID=UPI003CFDEE79